MSFIAPVIVVPGITASHLRDEYSLPPETVWAVLKKDFERIALHPDNIRYEAREPSRIAPDHIFEVAYKELIEELRFNLREKEDLPVPVFPFSYDWRQPLDMIEDQLAVFVKEVIERTKLLKHYRSQGYAEKPCISLIGHSMGGLIITGYLEKNGSNVRVSKVVTLATPFRGSFEAVIKISTGTANLGSSEPSSRERESARLTPALYHLLPSCNGIQIDNAPTPNIFEPGIWQKSIIDTLKEYVRIHSAFEGDITQQTQKLFNSLLATANEHRMRINNFKLEKSGLSENDWLCVIGANSTTRVRLNITKKDSEPQFNFQSSDRTDRWINGQTPEECRLTGDGTVPFEAALPTFIPPEKVVCVTPDDYGYWEVQDKIFSSMSGFHGILPNMDMLHRLIVRHLTGRPDTKGNTWGRRAPGVSKWQPPLDLKEKIKNVE